MNPRKPDRRECVRVSPDDRHRISAARVRPGHPAGIVNISAGGALVETDRALRPGTVVELQMDIDGHRLLVRARVLRCAVSQVHASSMKYRGAIAFDRHLPWFVNREGYGIPNAERRAGREEWADATQAGR